MDGEARAVEDGLLGTAGKISDFLICCFSKKLNNGKDRSIYEKQTAHSPYIHFLLATSPFLQPAPLLTKERQTSQDSHYLLASAYPVPIPLQGTLPFPYKGLSRSTDGCG